MVFFKLLFKKKHWDKVFNFNWCINKAMKGHTLWFRWLHMALRLHLKPRPIVLFFFNNDYFF